MMFEGIDEIPKKSYQKWYCSSVLDYPGRQLKAEAISPYFKMGLLRIRWYCGWLQYWGFKPDFIFLGNE